MESIDELEELVGEVAHPWRVPKAQALDVAYRRKVWRWLGELDEKIRMMEAELRKGA